MGQAPHSVRRAGKWVHFQVNSSSKTPILSSLRSWPPVLQQSDEIRNPDPPRSVVAAKSVARACLARGRDDLPLPPQNGDAYVSREDGSRPALVPNRRVSNTGARGRMTGKSKNPSDIDRMTDDEAPPTPSSIGSEPLDKSRALSQTHDEDKRAPPAGTIRSNRVVPPRSSSRIVLWRELSQETNIKSENLVLVHGHRVAAYSGALSDCAFHSIPTSLDST